MEACNRRTLSAFSDTRVSCAFRRASFPFIAACIIDAEPLYKALFSALIASLAAFARIAPCARDADSLFLTFASFQRSRSSYGCDYCQGSHGYGYPGGHSYGYDYGYSHGYGDDDRKVASIHHASSSAPDAAPVDLQAL